jgi:nickel-dependent lactate racemase
VDERYVICEGEKLCFALPRGWKVLTAEDRPPVPGVADPLAEIKRALDNPIGGPRLEELAKPGMDVALIFDDLQRPTPAHLAMPEIMDRLNQAGIPDSRITAICAVGTHPAYGLPELETKVGREVMSRLPGRVLSHDPYSSENIVIGKTHRGITVEVNPYVASADLVVGVGECMPHPCAGFGGGYKIIMPGVASYRAVADHHFTWMRHRYSKVNMLEGNGFHEEIADAGRLARLAFKLDLIINEKKEIIRGFAGEPAAEHVEATRHAASLYWVPMEKLADITITSAFPMEIAVQATKALTMAKFCTRSGGTIIWVAPQRQGAAPIMPLVREMASAETASDFHRRLIRGDIPDALRSFGISYIMQIVYFKELAETFNVIHVTEGLTAEEVKMMKFTHASTLPEAIEMVSRTVSKADVAIFPSGGTVIPGVL